MSIYCTPRKKFSINKIQNNNINKLGRSANLFCCNRMKIFRRLLNYDIYILIFMATFLIYGCGDDGPSTTPAVSEIPVDESMEETRPKSTQKLPQLGAGDAEGYYKFGVETIKKGNFELAVQAWDKAVQIDPTMVKALNFLGRAYYTQGMMLPSIRTYRQIVELEPENSDAYVNLGIALRYNEKFEESIEQFNKALAINPILALAHDELGMALLKMLKHDEAIKAYQNAIAIDSKFPQPHNHLGVVYLMKGMTKEAQKEFDLYRVLDKEKKANQPRPSGMGMGH